MPSRETEQPAHNPCSYAGCGSTPITRRRTKTGWTTLCRYHYDLEYQQESDAFCKANNLNTQAEKMAWCIAKLKLFGKPSKDWAYKILEDPNASWLQIELANRAIRQPKPERIPGEDDE